MKGLEVYVSTDYSTGPGPRVVLTIDCNELPNSWDLECEKELVKEIEPAFSEIAKFNSNDLSIILLNDMVKTIDYNDYEYDDYNIDLSYILSSLDEIYHMKSVWIHTINDLTDIYPHIVNDLGNYYCKSEKYIVCGKYDPNNSKIYIQGEQCEFPVRPLYRKSFNQKIWKINRNSTRDVTSKIDNFYNIWKNRNKEL